MRIGVDARELLRGRMTGIGRFLRNLLYGLLKADAAGEYFLFGYPDLDFDSGAKNLTKVAREKTLTLFWDQVYLPLAVRENGIDVFFSPYYKIPVFAGCGLVLTHHDFTMFTFPEYGKRSGYNAALKAAMRTFNGRAAKLVCVSEFTRRELERLFSPPPGKTAVIQESVGNGFFPRDPEKVAGARGKHGLEKRYLLYVGNSGPHKNVHGLVSAYGRLPPGLRAEYDLVLGGVNPGAVMGEGVRCLGHVPDEELAALYSGAELFVFPSFSEGFGLPPLEAMACGCPVASSNATCMPEVLGDACLYFNPGDVREMSSRIAEALGDAQVRAGLRRKGAERAGLYVSEKTAAALLDVFRSAAGGRAHCRRCGASI